MRKSMSRVCLGAVAAALLTTALASPAAAAEGTIRGTSSPTAISGSYLVVLNNTTTGSNSVGANAARLAGQHHGTVGFVYQAALRGFATRMSESDARRLAADPAVAYVQQNQVLSIAGGQTNPPS